MRASIFDIQARLIMRILPVIAKERRFALKGGTAINFFYRNMPRLSVDIDLTYLPVENRENTLKNISESLYGITETIKNKISNSRIFEKKDKSTGLIYALSVEHGNARVKIEPNLVIRGTVYGTQIQRLCDNAMKKYSASVKFNILSVADLYGSKICAALDRQHPRDFFDVKFLLDNEGLTDYIRKAFIVYLISHNRPIVELLDPNFKDISSTFENEFQGLTFYPVKLKDLENTRKDLVEQIHSGLTPDEREFLLSVKELRPDWNRLGITGIEKLPGVQWKLYNLKQMSKKEHSAAVNKLVKCLWS